MISAIIVAQINVPDDTIRATGTMRQDSLLNAGISLPRDRPPYARIGVQAARKLTFLVMVVIHSAPGMPGIEMTTATMETQNTLGSLFSTGTWAMRMPTKQMAMMIRIPSQSSRGLTLKPTKLATRVRTPVMKRMSRSSPRVDLFLLPVLPFLLF